MKHESYCNLGPVEAPADHPDCNCKDPLKGLGLDPATYKAAKKEQAEGKRIPLDRVCSDEYLREFFAGGLEQDHIARDES